MTHAALYEHEVDKTRAPAARRKGETWRQCAMRVWDRHKARKAARKKVAK